ncbi:hypothetical protein KQ51_01384 [Candidatus Izimaplasma bacterium HR1]|jgi:hypothetical protein|uniref:hypothetical protein n=1 Tax=Candidatus Izimoplasma sp. HR1 TaxID=1541959 RepID=UPI0004F647DD|nr:hypothetical protein KQ51_01384 [Candidatus Izimaplasma bacterium HR1]
MKKLMILLVAITISLTLGAASTLAASELPSYCGIPPGERTSEDGNDYTLCISSSTVGDRVYEGEYVTTEGTYHRIEYDETTGKWHGVSYITDINIMYDHLLGGWTRFDIKFSRDLKSLNSILLTYTTQRTCTTFFGICIPGTVEEADEERLFYENTVDDELWYQEADNITYYGNIPLVGERPTDLDYDYSIKLYGETRDIDTLEILEFEYVLTDAEIDQLQIDIQDQYDYEVTQIETDHGLSLAEKQELLSSLNDEYNAIPEIEYDMVFQEICLETDENCREVLPPTEESTAPTINDLSFTTFKDILKKVVFIVIGVIVLIIVGMNFGDKLLGILAEIMLGIANTIAIVIIKLIVDPFIAGVSVLANLFLKGISWKK